MGCHHERRSTRLTIRVGKMNNAGLDIADAALLLKHFECST
jgi:hypothetical protein